MWMEVPGATTCPQGGRRCREPLPEGFVPLSGAWICPGSEGSKDSKHGVESGLGVEGADTRSPAATWGIM